MKTVCGKCLKEFNLSVRTERLPGNVERVYFVCPKCGEEYTSHYIDDNIRDKQQEVKEMKKKYSRLRGRKPKEALDMFRELKEKMKEIEKDMEKLREDIKCAK